MLMNAGADVNAQGGEYSNVLQAARQKLKQLGLENVPTARYETHKPPL